MTADLKKLLADSKLPERTVPICLRADLVYEHERLDDDLQRLLETPPNSLGGDGRSELRDRIVALEAEMQDATVEFRLRALPGPKHRALVGDHPPRRQDDGETPMVGDAEVGFNPLTYFPAVARACIVEPELDDDTWAELQDKLTDRQFNELATAAWLLNRGRVDVPFSRAASTMSRRSGSE